MAARKISELTALTTPASGDYLPIVDISEVAAADKNKRITIEELMRGAPNGTAAAPGIAFEGDPNTGIYSPGADQLALSTSGAGRMFIDANGKVGLLAASTGAYFRAQGVTGTTIIEAYSADSNGTADVEIKSNGTTGSSRLLFSDTAAQSGIIRYSHATNSLEFFTAASERARIDSSGRLLIGTSSDSGGALLQVNGNRIRVATAKTPASASDTGTAGEICWDANYIYVCTATNTWKRSALSTW